MRLGSDLHLVPRVRHRWQCLVDTFLLRTRPRAENPFVTHLPVLLALAATDSIRRVLELGSGTCSTLTFLERNCFPDLQRLDSYENDSNWAEQVQTLVGDDPRFQLTLVAGAIEDVLQGTDLNSYDLVLVDDSLDGSQRTSTIKKLASLSPLRATIVIHDYEYAPYREAARGFTHRFRFTGLNPNTGVIWNHNRKIRPRLTRLNQMFNRLRAKPSLDDRNALAAWVRQNLYSR